MMESFGRAGSAILLVSRVLPSWLSYLLLSSLFWVVWLHPAFVGWEGAAGLRSLVFLEVIGVAVLAFFLSGRSEPLGWLPIPASAGILCLVLWYRIGAVVAVALPLHLVVRSIALWRDRTRVLESVRALGLSVVLMVVVWLAVGLLPLPALGWTPSATPQELWWNVVGWRGWRPIPFALPAWGCVYFLLTSLVHLFDVRWHGWFVDD